MPEKFEVVTGNDFPTWFIIHSYGFKENEIDINKEWQVCLTINGVEVPVRQTLLDWGKHLDNFIEEKAKELVEEKLSAVDEICFNFKQFLKETFNIKED